MEWFLVAWVCYWLVCSAFARAASRRRGRLMLMRCVDKCSGPSALSAPRIRSIGFSVVM
eukprot:CAMPEP_0185438232 /NCGR_PEP_ID=MMETSP1365-20130426/34001_1 /TAXON_ID=38817 /ORGANISM="Gephyrocapsa oceanica, Strain RCC1303" /LENGTH=58 /DNA_ID=CAMNT_0028043399 /DNA_START=1 /DNA_END=174 /DNA_ORIENTATION=+